MALFEQENVESRKIAVVGIFGAILIFVAIIGIQVIFYRLEKADQKVKNASMPSDVTRANREWVTEINSYRWVDKNAQTVSVPMERAKQLIVEQFSEKKR